MTIQTVMVKSSDAAHGVLPSLPVAGRVDDDVLSPLGVMLGGACVL